MKRIYWLWTLAALLAVGSVNVMAQRVGNSELASVSGIVINHFTGAPISAVAVTLKPDAGSGRTVFTDQNGRFALERLPIGRYSVSAASKGYFRARHDGVRRKSR